MSKFWEVKVPIAGHAFVEVQAETEEEAISNAMMEVGKKHLEEWIALERFNQGNICYCPHPWQVEAVCVEDDDK